MVRYGRYGMIGNVGTYIIILCMDYINIIRVLLYYLLKVRTGNPMVTLLETFK